MQFQVADAATEYGWTVGENYTDGAEIDFSRMGSLGDDTLDMRSRTDDSRDLIFGLDGNDTIYGGGGNDHLIGDLDDDMEEAGDDVLDGGAGVDRLLGGLGRDKLYGDDNGDWLFGGDDNDFLDCGLNVSNPDWEEETMDGGDGDDILLMRGVRCIATGGAGDDQFWIVGRSANGGDTHIIMDSESGDSIYWNGYRLLGGTKMVVELINDPVGSNYYHSIGAVDANGFLYYLYGTALSISAPDGSGIMIEDFVNGDFGINVGAAITEGDFVWSYDAEEQRWEYETELPLSSICLNDNDYDIQNLAGFANTLANDDPTNAIPTTWLP